MKGDKVRIVGGVFDGLFGLHSGMTAGERELVLLVVLGAQRQVAAPSHLLTSAP